MQKSIPCSVNECERTAQRNGMCKGHDQRMKRNGNPGPPTFRRAPGSAAPECQHHDCSSPAASRGWCAAHYQRWYDGRPLDGPIKTFRKEPSGVCNIEGCEDSADSRGWCGPHYQRWYRTGDPGPARRRQYGVILTCSAEGCDRPHRTRGYCDMHYRRWKRGVPTDSKKFLQPPAKMDPNSYAAVHDRIRRTRGPASASPCIECLEPAAQWAYQHNDPSPRFNAAGMPYSTNIGHCYAPMCRSCHGLLDRDLDRREWLLDLEK